VNHRDGRTILIAPAQCQFVPSVNRFLQTLQSQDASPFDEIKYVHVPSSMRSGGGPACLRLRVILTSKQEKAVSGRVLLTPELLKELVGLVKADYPTEASERMFIDETFLKTCFDATRRIYEILGLDPIGTSPSS
jgi:succinylarginine dihydrolase